VRQLRPDQAAANAQRGKVGLIAEALDELEAASDEAFYIENIEIYDRDPPQQRWPTLRDPVYSGRLPG
jgi:hypothetical protein